MWCGYPRSRQEDQRRLHRERDRLIKEQGAHTTRIKALLVAHGIRLEIRGDFLQRLKRAKGGGVLGLMRLEADLKAELSREYERYQLVARQIKVLESTQKVRAEALKSEAMRQVQALMLLRGLGWQSSFTLVMEFFAWRAFRNQRELGACAGLTPTPYASGDSEREQGIEPKRATGVYVA